MFVPCVLVFLYFFCPYIYILPLLTVYGKHSDPPPWVRFCFKPIVYLMDHVPLYCTFLEKEGRLLNRD